MQEKADEKIFSFFLKKPLYKWKKSCYIVITERE